MALVKTENIGAQVDGFNRLPIVRQIGLMIGLAASVALAVSIVLWTQGTSYRMLYGNLSDQEVLEISGALNQANIKYEVNESTGAILVDGNRVHEARMQLAGQGLPKGSGIGYELLDKEQGFGASQFSETKRYQRAVEGELAKTISSLNNVQSARIHLAIPKQSSFVRDRKKTSASVFLSLYQGRVMNVEQAMSIAHLVASSIPSLEVDGVTVIDQNGRLLTRSGGDEDIAFSSTQFDYRKNLEAYYRKRIEEIIEPIIGLGRVRAQVVASLDFTVTEQTQESFNPDLPSIRSEQTIEDSSTGSSAVGGVPGTLSNRPPETGAGSTELGLSGSDVTPSKNNSRRLVRNYELDRTVSHTRHQTGKIKRLSAAVVIDNRADGVSLSDEEINKLTDLVKEAMGFDVSRGDSINLINSAFQVEPEPEPLPEPSLLEQPWVFDLAKQVFAFVVVIFVMLSILKPILKNLSEKGMMSSVSSGTSNALAGQEDQMVALGNDKIQQMAVENHERQIESVKSVAQQDPRRVAQVVTDWVATDG